MKKINLFGVSILSLALLVGAIANTVHATTSNVQQTTETRDEMKESSVPEESNSTTDPSDPQELVTQKAIVNDSSQTETSSSEPQLETAIINGEVVHLEPPVKEGQDEANRTEAPKEELREGNARAARAAVGSVPMYRLYNPNSGEHFYTQNAAERDNVRAHGWNYEGIGWQAPTSGTAVYRVYNKNSGEHFYTTNKSEKDHLVKVGWRYEGIAFYSAAKNSNPVYRLFNPNTKGPGSHHYTLLASERDNLKRHGWRDEGVAFYAVGGSQQNHDDYRLLGVKNYNQYALGAPSGCEGAALLQGLQYKGKLTSWSLRSFLNTIPKSSNGNPNNGFVGSPFVENSWTYSAIYPAPLTNWGKKYGNVQNISGSSMNTLINEVKNGNPVVAWVTINFQPIRWGNWSFGVAANNNHAVTLDGFNKGSNQVHVSDPISGSYWLSRTTFENIYNARKYAVVVK